MLVLERLEGQRIMFGDDIVLTIVRLKNDTVRIGITAPSDLPVHREEVYDKIQKAKDTQ